MREAVPRVGVSTLHCSVVPDEEGGTGRGMGISEVAQSSHSQPVSSLCPSHKNANHAVCGPARGSSGHSERVGGEVAPLSSFEVLLPIKGRNALGRQELWRLTHPGARRRCDRRDRGKKGSELELSQPIEGSWR